jgi:hypothetical protein
LAKINASLIVGRRLRRWKKEQALVAELFILDDCAGRNDRMQPIERQVSDEIPRRYVNLCDWPIILFGNFISNRVKGYDFYDNVQVVLKGLTAARVLILEPVPIVIGRVADGCSINASTVVSASQ